MEGPPMKLITRVLAVAALVAAAAGAPTSASAATPVEGTRSAEPTIGFAPAPTTSPAVSRQFLTNRNDFDCPNGYGCALVPYGNGYYFFKFYNYGTYYLSYWSGTEAAFNAQTDGAAMRLYDSSGSQVKCIPAYDWDYVDWEPIWSISLTASPC
jgi:hypothetical protein